MITQLVYAGLNATGLSWLRRWSTRAGVILCYHNVVAEPLRDGDTAPGLHVPLGRFVRHMRWLREHYDVLGLDELLDRRAAGRSLAGAACVTFDDAYVGVFRHAWPALQELGITPTVFVIAQAPAQPASFWWDHPSIVAATNAEQRELWLGRLRGDGQLILRSLPRSAKPVPQVPRDCWAADWRTIRAAVREGIQIGAHSATHRSLPTLSDSELIEEIDASRDVVAAETGAVPSCFAVPYGRWDRRVRERIREAGYRAALTLDYGLVTSATDPWALPRINVSEGMTDYAYRAWLSGLSLRHLVGA